jgi:hypothetical protein
VVIPSKRRKPIYDAGKIVTGAIIFLILLAFPIWYVAATGKGNYVPQPEIVSEEEQCIESAEYMRKKHMILLDEWRGRVVRERINTYVASDGIEYEISLTGTCLSCHSNKPEFCDQCHDYAGIDPSCWDCHTEGE